MRKAVKTWAERAGLKKAKQRNAAVQELMRLTPFVNRLLAAESIEQQNNPARLSELAFSLYSRQKKNVEYVKDSGSDQALRQRFSRLVDEIKSGFSPFTGQDGIEIIAAANHFLGLSQEIDSDPGMDVGSHFHIASSFASKGRLLYNAVKVFRPSTMLEVGTAYGMSARFMMSAAERYTPGSSLHTIEASEPQFSLARNSLNQRFGDNVHCYNGLSTDMIPSIRESAGRIDLVFHDGAHDGDIYEADFAALLPVLGAGSIIIFDDIRWFDKRIVANDPGCYRGWRAIVEHAEVSCAVEIDGSVGIALISG